jgi:hypothetical protein
LFAALPVSNKNELNKNGSSYFQISSRFPGRKKITWEAMVGNDIFCAVAGDLACPGIFFAAQFSITRLPGVAIGRYQTTGLVIAAIDHHA